MRKHLPRFTVEAVVGDVVTLKRLTLGSSPVGGAKNRDVLLNVFIFFFQIEFGQ